MNVLVVNSRAFYNEFINDDDFLTDTGDYSTYFKAQCIERIKVASTISIKTIVTASASYEILFETDGTDATWTLPVGAWSTEGFKVGNTIEVAQGANTDTATISSLSGSVMITNDPGFTGAPLNLVDNTLYNDIEIRNTTLPTSLIFKFGVVPNVDDTSAPVTGSAHYKSILDGQQQAYSCDSFPVFLTPLMTAGSDISETIFASYNTTIGTHTFVFEVEHVFRPEFYIEAWLLNLINGTQPTSFTFPDSYRYIAYYKFGTSATDPNEYRIFIDSELNGSLAFPGFDFNNTVGAYTIESIYYENSDGIEIDQLEVTDTTTVLIKVKKSTGNFSAGSKAILYHSKLPTSSVYANSATSWSEIRLFDTTTNVDGSGLLIDGTYIKDFSVVVDADPTVLNVGFNIEYDAAAQATINEGDLYALLVQVGDFTVSAALSDRKVVVAGDSYTKNTDISGLVSGNAIELYTPEKDPSSGVGDTSNLNAWNGRLYLARCTFDLDKVAGTANATNITQLRAQIITWDGASEEGILDEFIIPFSTPYKNVNVGGAIYQNIDYTGYRDFGILSTATANTIRVIAEVPASLIDQPWDIQWPFIIPHRTDLYNPTIPDSFYDSAEPNNNQNFKTSNYSNVGGFDIYIRLIAVVSKLGINTEYGIYSDSCVVRDYDTDPPTSNWTASTLIKDEDGNTLAAFNPDDVNIIETTFSMPTAGSLTAADLLAEHRIYPTSGTGESVGSDNRLHSEVEWGYSGNVIEPVDSETKVKILQNIAGNTIVVSSQIKEGVLDPEKTYDVESHLYNDK